MPNADKKEHRKPPSNKVQSTVEPKSQSSNQKTTFFGFLNKPKPSAAAAKEKKDKKKEKDRLAKNKNKKNLANASSKTKAETNYPPFVPSKRLIDYHDYQNQSVIDESKNANQTQLVDKPPRLRQFGDTNILKNKKDKELNNLNKRNLKNIANLRSNGETKKYLPNVTTFSEIDAKNLLAFETQNDTGFSSLDGECNNSFPNFCTSKYFNVDIKNGKPSSANALRYSGGASSSSNLSGSTISDSNSLDSMEHEIIHRKSANSESMSYLGPFNFRQLLRPTQGPTESLRKKRGYNCSLTPPPLQKGKTKNL